MSTTIFMANLGYLRGINGRLSHHVRYAYRHVYSSRKAQNACLDQVRGIMERKDPDLCCFVEIDKGSSDTGNFNQLEALASAQYGFFDIENKYGPASRLRRFPIMRGKSNGFLAKRPYDYEKLFFTHGTKRLIYKITLEAKLTLFFAHFSLKQEVRAHQLKQFRQLAQACAGEVILLGDFNVHNGFSELAPLLEHSDLVLLNREDEPTFTFHRMQMPLDLCICSKSLASRAQLKIVPQPYSDHHALLLTLT